MAAVQVKFDRQNTNEQAIAKKTTDAGTIFFTKDKHQIIIGGEIYGGQQHKIIEHDHDIYTQIPASQADNDFQAYLAKLYNMDLSTGKADPVNPDDYYVYKYQVVDNHAGEGTKHTTGSNPDGAHQSTASMINPSTGQPYAAGSVPVIYSRVCYVCTVAPVITYDASRTPAYQCTSLGEWQPLDGNYDADKVYLGSDITMAGNYTQVGNLQKTQTGTSTFACKGMTVKEALEAILMKVEWPGNPTYDTTIAGPGASSFSYPGVPDLYVYSGSTTRLTNGQANVVEVGSVIHIGGSSTHSTAAGRKITYATVQLPSSLDSGWTVATADAQGISVSLPNPNWGLADTAAPSGIANPKYSGWSNTGKSFSFAWTRTGGAGELKLTDTQSGSFGSVTYDGAHSATWNAGAAAGDHTISGGTVTSGFGSTTIKLSKTDTDTYSRSANPSTITTNPLSAYWIVNNVGTTSDSKKTSSKAAVSVTDGNPNAAASNSGSASVSCVIHSVYPLRHNGTTVTGTIPDDPSDNTQWSDAWSAATSGTQLSGKGDGLLDVFGATSSKTYYIKWALQSSTKQRYVDVPQKNANGDFCSISVQVRLMGTWTDLPATTSATNLAPAGWKRYIINDGGSGGPAVLKVTITK
jgi:hypothetical protein